MAVQNIDINESNEEADSKDISNGNHSIGEWIKFYLACVLMDCAEQSLKTGFNINGPLPHLS
jgi:hypothetical protein